MVVTGKQRGGQMFLLKPGRRRNWWSQPGISNAHDRQPGFSTAQIFVFWLEKISYGRDSWLRGNALKGWGQGF